MFIYIDLQCMPSTCDQGTRQLPLQLLYVLLLSWKQTVSILAMCYDGPPGMKERAI